jgi:hypothetical protein
MASKIAAFLLTLIINTIVAVFIFFMMLVIMNGFSESDAEWGLIAYVVLAAVTAILTSIGAVVLSHLLQKKQFSPVMSTLIAVPVFAIVGVIVEIVCSIAGVGIAEFVRVNY